MEKVKRKKHARLADADGLVAEREVKGTQCRAALHKTPGVQVVRPQVAQVACNRLAPAPTDQAQHLQMPRRQVSRHLRGKQREANKFSDWESSTKELYLCEDKAAEKS